MVEEPLEEAIRGLSEPQYRREGDTHILEFPRLNVELAFSKLDVGKETKAWLEIRSQWPTSAARLYDGTFNLSGLTSRTTMAKYLDQRCGEVPDWSEVLEQACFRVFDVIREGEPVQRIGSIPKREGSRYRVDPIQLEKLPVIIFGEGGTGKSLLAATLALAVHDGWMIADLPVIKGPVLVLDWETDGVTYQEQFERLAEGHNVSLPEIHYRLCGSPLRNEAESVARIIAREGIEFVIVDSLGYACGGDKNSQEVTTGMFAAMRGWRTSVLCIDHIAKGEHANSPYGSVYTTNSARQVWQARGGVEDGSDELVMSLTQTKRNFAPHPPMGFRFRFTPSIQDPTGIYCERADVRDLPGLRDDLPVSMRIKTALLDARQSMTVTDLAVVLYDDPKPSQLTQVRSRLTDLVKRGEVIKIAIAGGANRWALAVSEVVVGEK